MYRDDELNYACAGENIAEDDRTRIRVTRWSATRRGTQIAVLRVTLWEIEVGELYSDRTPDLCASICDLAKRSHRDQVAACEAALAAVASRVTVRTWLVALSQANQSGFENGRNSVREEFRQLMQIR